VRDALLKHKTGTLGLDLMNHREQGFKYDLTLRMDPNVFLPFVPLPKTREIIQRFGFDDTSFIDVPSGLRRALHQPARVPQLRPRCAAQFQLQKRVFV
jgi:hypothetical protein